MSQQQHQQHPWCAAPQEQHLFVAVVRQPAPQEGAGLYSDCFLMEEGAHSIRHSTVLTSTHNSTDDGNSNNTTHNTQHLLIWGWTPGVSC